MDIRKFMRSLLFLVAAISLSLQISMAFIIRVDVFAKIIPMQDGTEKVDVAIVGGDHHTAATSKITWQFSLGLMEALAGNNCVEMFVENMYTPSHFTNSIEYLPQDFVDRAIEKNLLYTYLYADQNIGIEPIASLVHFSLSHNAFNRIGRFLNPNINFVNFFKNVSITNLEWRQGTQYLELIIQTPEKFDQPDFHRDCISMLSSDFFNKVLNILEQWEHESGDDYALKKIFAEAKEQCSFNFNACKQAVIRSEVLNPGKLQKYEDVLETILRPTEQQGQYFRMGLIQCLLDIFSDHIHLSPMIQATALWHICNIKNRVSKRTISLTGAAHAYAPNMRYIVGLTLGDYLQKIGYTLIDSIDFDSGISPSIREGIGSVFNGSTSLKNFLESDLGKSFRMAEENFAQKSSKFIGYWATMSDDEVRQKLLDRELELQKSRVDFFNQYFS